MFDQIKIELDRARDAYNSSLTAIDSKLRTIVSRDPKSLAAARAIQASYTDDIKGCDLAAAEQPAAGEAPTMAAPKRVRNAAKKKKK